MNISADDKNIAKYVLQTIGGTPRVFKHQDSGSIMEVDVLLLEDKPDAGVNSYSTMGLSNYPTGYTVGDKELRVELLGAAYSKFEFMSNIVAGCAFNIINGYSTIFHGVIYKNIIDVYYSNSELKHVLFTSPYLWAGFETLDFQHKQVVWLMAIPISENEFNYADEYGSDALSDLLESKNIDPLNLERSSVL